MRIAVGSIIRAVEYALALVVLAGVCVACWETIHVLMVMDWSQPETFYELIYRVLQLVIGLELVRMLIAHSLSAVLELIAFVIARKMLKPDVASLDIALSVGAFVALIAARHAFVRGGCEDCMQSKREQSEEIF